MGRPSPLIGIDPGPLNWIHLDWQKSRNYNGPSSAMQEKIADVIKKSVKITKHRLADFDFSSVAPFSSLLACTFGGSRSP
jgi:hypothetical protein